MTISKSENKNSARSFRFIDCPETMVTKSCLRNVRSMAAKCIKPSIRDSICSNSRLSFSVQFIFTAISCTCFCDSISDSWSGCIGSVCFSKVWKKYTWIIYVRVYILLIYIDSPILFNLKLFKVNVYTCIIILGQ